MLGIVGTVPDQNFSLTIGKAVLKQGKIHVKDQKVEVNRGTPALLGAVCKTCEFLGLPEPLALLVGDVGLGQGSRKLYAYLEKELNNLGPRTLTFHYLQPDVDWHNRVLLALQEMDPKPTLIADAGFMYAAKMSGQAEEYDLFTPDMGEVAFLADEKAPHPFYTRGFILHEDNQAQDLIVRAYKHQNAARYLLVKGRTDYVACEGKILAAIEDESEEVLEAIGGTGDTITGMVSALIHSGMDMESACVLAARANRLAGRLAKPTPATQIEEIIEHIPRALQSVNV
ncbi:NAD(P)H-hydrate dehydratase [Desulfovulcanus sp.]